VLKKRIIPIQLLQGQRLVKTREFSDPRDVGDPIKSAAVYNSQNADELIFLNIDRNSDRLDELVRILPEVAKVCFMPLTVGGGISKWADAARLFERGADKVVLNSATFKNYSIIEKIASRFGAQAVVVALDVYRRGSGTYELASSFAKNPEKIDLRIHIKKCEECGAGEFFVQSVEREGSMAGFDLELFRLVCKASKIPVIGSGGAGHYEHLRSAFCETPVSAVACGSLFNFSDSNPLRAKAFLKNAGIPLKVI